MNVNLSSIVESLTNLILVIGNDNKLCRWFEGLAKKSSDDRRNEIYAMSEKIGSKRKTANLVTAFKLLAIPEVFEAAAMALKDKCCESLATAKAYKIV